MSEQKEDGDKEDNREYIGLYVHEDVKERWQTAAEINPEYRSLTHLISHSVEMELRDDDDIDGEVEVDMSRFHDRFDDVEQKLDDIEDRADDIYVLVRRDEQGDVMDVVSRILELTPEPADVDEMINRDPNEFDDLHRRVRATGDVAAIAEIMMSDDEYRSSEINRAIEVIDAEMESVTVREIERGGGVDKRIYRVPE